MNEVGLIGHMQKPNRKLLKKSALVVRVSLIKRWINENT